MQEMWPPLVSQAKGPMCKLWIWGYSQTKEVSKSGTAILPSKRVRRIPEKINFKEDNEKNTDQEKEANPKPEQDLSSEEEKAEK